MSSFTQFVKKYGHLTEIDMAPGTQTFKTLDHICEIKYDRNETPIGWKITVDGLGQIMDVVSSSLRSTERQMTVALDTPFSERPRYAYTPDLKLWSLRHTQSGVLFVFSTHDRTLLPEINIGDIFKRTGAKMVIIPQYKLVITPKIWMGWLADAGFDGDTLPGEIGRSDNTADTDEEVLLPSLMDGTFCLVTERTGNSVHVYGTISKESTIKVRLEDGTWIERTESVCYRSPFMLVITDRSPELMAKSARSATLPKFLSFQYALRHPQDPNSPPCVDSIGWNFIPPELLTAVLEALYHSSPTPMSDGYLLASPFVDTIACGFQVDGVIPRVYLNGKHYPDSDLIDHANSTVRRQFIGIFFSVAVAQ